MENRSENRSTNCKNQTSNRTSSKTTNSATNEHSRDQYIRAGQGLAERNRLGKGFRSQQSCRIHKVGIHAGERSHEAADRDQRKQHEVEE